MHRAEYRMPARLWRACAEGVSGEFTLSLVLLQFLILTTDQRPEIVEELSRWNRRKSSRHAPEKFLLSVLLEQVQTSEAVQNVPVPTQAVPLTSGDVNVLDQNTFNPLPQTHRDIPNAPLVPHPMAGITRSLNPSPTVSSSSSVRSTLSSVYPDPEDSQRHSVHSTCHPFCFCLE
jgi:hypothetical protein